MYKWVCILYWIFFIIYKNIYTNCGIWWMACFWILQEYALADSVWAYSLHYVSSAFFIDFMSVSPFGFTVSVYQSHWPHFLIMVVTLAGSVLVLAAPAVVCVCWGKFNVLWIIFGDANFRGINVIAILEEVFKGCFLLLFLCWWGFYAELHVVDEPTFCHNQPLWLCLRLHLVLPLERYSKPILLLLCLLLWCLLYV